MATVDSFLRSLAAAKAPTGFLNPYERPATIHNLRLFLRGGQSRRHVLILIGEAPGYRGATQSGVPLCSLSVLTEDWGDPWGRFGPSAGYMVPDECSFTKEATASIVWSVLAQSFRDWPAPLTWNAVPFQPFRGSVHSNASLRRREVQIGQHWLAAFVELFPAASPVALGVRASEALDSLGIRHHRVRHPSRGGKAKFREGLIQLKEQLASQHFS